jgi:hypothetical protein
LAYTVVDIESFQTGLAEDISMNNILEKLALPTVCNYNKNSKHLHTFVASRMKPDKLAKCLVYHKNYIVNHNLSVHLLGCCKYESLTIHIWFDDMGYI